MSLEKILPFLQILLKKACTLPRLPYNARLRVVSSVGRASDF